MIDAKSLRIGNWVNAKFQTEDFNFQVKGISDDDFVTMDKVNNYHLNCLQPIELSPSILIKCGFEESKGKFHIGINYEHFIVYKVGDVYDHWYFYREETRITSGIKYLHDLQNLYLLLTGKELEINL